MVTKASYPHLDEDDLIKEYIIPAEDVLGSIDKRLYWFVSEAVNYEPGARKRLGLRARHWKTALRHITDMTPAAASIEAPAIEDAVSEEKPKVDAAKQSAKVERCKILCEHPSDPEQADKKATEQLARDSEECHKLKLYHNPDPLASKTLHFKLKMYAAHVVSKGKEVAATRSTLAAALQSHIAISHRTT